MNEAERDALEGKLRDLERQLAQVGTSSRLDQVTFARAYKAESHRSMNAGGQEGD